MTKALYLPNLSPIRVTIDWSAHTFRIRGRFDVAEEDPDTAPAVSVDVDVRGTITNQPPVAIAGPPQTIECASPEGAMVTLDASGSTDADGNLLSIVWRQGGAMNGPILGYGAAVTVQQPIGMRTYRATALDTMLQLGGDTTTVEVVDTTAPAIVEVTLTTACLWPPQHDYVRFRLGEEVRVEAEDACTPVPTVRIVDVVSDQPDDAVGLGDGSTSRDVIFGENGFCVRSERAGGLPLGRTYTVRIAVTDASGHQSLRDVTITAPHDQRVDCPALDPAAFVSDSDADEECAFDPIVTAAPLRASASVMGMTIPDRDAAAAPAPPRPRPGGCAVNGEQRSNAWLVLLSVATGLAFGCRRRVGSPR